MAGFKLNFGKRPVRASETPPPQNPWLEHAPANPTDWMGDQWQRLQGGDLFPGGMPDAVQTGSAMTQQAPTGYYVDYTNRGGAVLNANTPDPYAATVGRKVGE